MNTSPPDGSDELVDTQVGSRGLGTNSEYVRELIRKDQNLQQLRDLLLAGAQSAPTPPVDAAYFDSLRKRISSHKTSK